MNNIFLLISLFSLVIFASVEELPAVYPGKSIEYRGGGTGKVIFDGRTHRIKGNSCTECHPDIFTMKGSIQITMADIYVNKFCGACHNGKISFDARDRTNCGMCHKK